MRRPGWALALLLVVGAALGVAVAGFPSRTRDEPLRINAVSTTTTSTTSTSTTTTLPPETTTTLPPTTRRPVTTTTRRPTPATTAKTTIPVPTSQSTVAGDASPGVSSPA